MLNSIHPVVFAVNRYGNTILIADNPGTDMHIIAFGWINSDTHQRFPHWSGREHSAATHGLATLHPWPRADIDTVQKNLLCNSLTIEMIDTISFG